MEGSSQRAEAAGIGSGAVEVLRAVTGALTGVAPRSLDVLAGAATLPP